MSWGQNYSLLKIFPTKLWKTSTLGGLKTLILIDVCSSIEWLFVLLQTSMMSSILYWAKTMIRIKNYLWRRTVLGCQCLVSTFPSSLESRTFCHFQISGNGISHSCVKQEWWRAQRSLLLDAVVAQRVSLVSRRGSHADCGVLAGHGGGDTAAVVTCIGVLAWVMKIQRLQAGSRWTWWTRMTLLFDTHDIHWALWWAGLAVNHSVWLIWQTRFCRHFTAWEQPLVKALHHSWAPGNQFCSFRIAGNKKSGRE